MLLNPNPDPQFQYGFGFGSTTLNKRMKKFDEKDAIVSKRA